MWPRLRHQKFRIWLKVDVKYASGCWRRRRRKKGQSIKCKYNDINTHTMAYVCRLFGIRLMPSYGLSVPSKDIYLSVDPNNIVNSKISSLAWMPCTVCEQLRIDWNMDLSKMRLTVRLFNVCISLGFYVCMRIGMECAFFGRRIYTQRNGMDWVMDSHFVWSRAYLVNFVKQPKSSEQSTHRWWHAFKSLKKIIVLAQCDGYSFDESLWFLWLDQRERERKRKW